MSAFDIDLFVIGGGSGGVRAARIAAGYGARVMMAEEYRVGGTCVIRGCVPKKLLVYASRFSHDFEEAAGFGWTLGEPRFDWSTLIANKDREIDRLEGIYRTNLQNSGVEIVDSRAVIEDPHTVRIVNTGALVRARYILVAVGAHPTLEPPIPGGELGITSNEIFHLERQPERIIVVGAGYIAVEFAGIFQGLGQQGDPAAPGRQAPARLRRGSARRARRGLRAAGHGACPQPHHQPLGEERRRASWCIGPTVRPGSGPGPRRNGDAVRTPVGSDSRRAGISGRCGGRHPGRRLLADADALDLCGRGRDESGPNLTPIAIREGHAFADTVFRRQAHAGRPLLIPTAVFSTPEIGTVGLSEAAARRFCDDIEIYKTSFRPMRAPCRAGTTGAHEAHRRQGHRQGAGRPHRGPRRRRDDPERRESPSPWAPPRRISTAPSRSIPTAAENS
jgi:glutathione reductase (NADPH)